MIGFTEGMANDGNNEDGQITARNSGRQDLGRNESIGPRQSSNQSNDPSKRSNRRRLNRAGTECTEGNESKQLGSTGNLSRRSHNIRQSLTKKLGGASARKGGNKEMLKEMKELEKKLKLKIDTNEKMLSEKQQSIV